MSGAEQAAGPVVAVALKWVDRRPEVDPLTGAVVTDPRTSGASAADRSALEWALRAAEAWAGHVVAVTVGPPGADVVLRDAIAAGARRAVRVAAAPDAPSEDVAAGLAAVVGGASLVVCGDWSLDRGSGSVPAFLAGHLGAAQALGCTGIALDPGRPGAVQAERRLDGGRRERLRIRPPGVVSVEGGTALLRRASLAGVLRSRRAPIELVTPTSRRSLPAPPPPLGTTNPVSTVPDRRSASPLSAREGGAVSPSSAPEGRSDPASSALEGLGVSEPPAPMGRSDAASPGGPVSSSPASESPSDATSSALERGAVSRHRALVSGPDPASLAPARPWGATPAVPRRSAYRPRPRVLPPPPPGLDARQRILVLTSALVERTPPRLLVLDPPAAADRILDQLRAWGYLDPPSGPAPGETDPPETDAASGGPAAFAVFGLSGPAPQMKDPASGPAALGVSGPAQREPDAPTGPAAEVAAGVSAAGPREADVGSGPVAGALPGLGGPALQATDAPSDPEARPVLGACGPAADETAGPGGSEWEVEHTGGPGAPEAPGPTGTAGRETLDAGTPATGKAGAPQRPAAPGTGAPNSPAAQEVEGTSDAAAPEAG